MSQYDFHEKIKGILEQLGDHTKIILYEVQACIDEGRDLEWVSAPKITVDLD